MSHVSFSEYGLMNFCGNTKFQLGLAVKASHLVTQGGISITQGASHHPRDELVQRDLWQHREQNVEADIFLGFPDLGCSHLPST